MNRVTSVIEPNNKQTTYAYDDNNRITTKEDSVDTASPNPGTILGNKGHVETYFDKLYRVIQTRTNDPEGQIWVPCFFRYRSLRSIAT
jgi:YD repeat-containing protein